jgi:hypothetical protein
MVMGALDLAKIVALAKSPQYFRAIVRFSGNEKVGMSPEDFDEGGAVVEA